MKEEQERWRSEGTLRGDREWRAGGRQDSQNRMICDGSVKEGRKEGEKKDEQGMMGNEREWEARE